MSFLRQVVPLRPLIHVIWYQVQLRDHSNTAKAGRACVSFLCNNFFSFIYVTRFTEATPYGLKKQTPDKLVWHATIELGRGDKFIELELLYFPTLRLRRGLLLMSKNNNNVSSHSNLLYGREFQNFYGGPKAGDLWKKRQTRK